MIWAFHRRPRVWFAFGLMPSIQLLGKCDYGAMDHTGLLVRDTARVPLPDACQIRGIVEARLEAHWGGDIVVSAAHFDSPFGDGVGTAKAAHLRMARGWVGNGGARICAGDFNWTANDAEMGRIYTNSPHFSDVWGATIPGNPGYNYNGVAYMNAGNGMHGRIDRILCANEVRAIARSVELVGPRRCVKYLGRPHVGRRNAKCDRSTTSASLLISPWMKPRPRAGGPPRRALAQTDLKKIGDMPDEEGNIISRHNDARRGVTASGIRDALISLERAPPKDTSVEATIARFRIAYPKREGRAKYTSVRTLAAALRLRNLPCTGIKAHLADRISTAFAIPPPEISIAIDMDGASGGGTHRGLDGRGM